MSKKIRVKVVLYEIFEKLGKPVIISLIATLIVTYLGFGTTTINYIYNIFNPSRYVSSTHQRMFLDAETAYDFGDYSKALQLYDSLSYDGFAMAKMNIAYMTANGLGIEKNVVTAEKTYRELLNNGEESALIELVKLYSSLRPCEYDLIIDLIGIGVDSQNPEISKLVEFMLDTVKMDKLGKQPVDVYNNLTNESKRILVTSFVEENYLGRFDFEKTQPNSCDVLYRYISTRSEFSSEGSSVRTIYVYDVFKISLFSDLLMYKLNRIETE